MLVFFVQHFVLYGQSSLLHRERADSLQQQATRFYKFSSDYAQAIPLQLQALEIWQRLGDSVQIAGSFFMLARGFAAVGDTNRAKQYATDAKNFFARRENHRHFFSCIAFLAELEIARRANTTAFAFLVEADVYFVRHAIRDSSLLPASLYVQKATLAMQRGEYRQARLMNSIAGQLFNMFKNNHGAREQFNGKCAENVFAARISIAEQQSAKALRELRSMHYDSAQAGRLQLQTVLDWYQAAAAAFAGIRRYDSAYFYESAARFIADSLSNLSKMQMLANVQMRYDAERSNERLLALERENMLQTQARTYLMFAIALLTGLLVVSGVAYYLKRGSERLLQVQNAELDRLNTEKTEFLNIAAHDLKSPLAAIELSMRLSANEPGIHPRLREVIERTRQSAEAMMSLISRLLDLSAIESGLQTLRPSTFNVDLLLQTLVAEWQEAASTKLLSFTYTSANTALLLHTDRDILRQALDNLCSNAVKFTPPGFQAGVELHLTTNNPISVQISIWNEGVVIASDEHEQLFGHFKRLSTQPTGGEHSSGLGLSIVKRLVTMLGGRVWCKSDNSVNAAVLMRHDSSMPPRITFIIEIPLHKEFSAT
jgi:signal transduction histidine kinase